MVSLESLATTPMSFAARGEECDAAFQTKMEMFRERKGPSVLSRRLNRKLNRKLTEETEGTSTTDTDGTDSGSQKESDALSSDEAIDFDDVPDTACDMFRSPDPFDFMPSVRVNPAFSEKEVRAMAPQEVH